jgi:hypothetical protein
VRVRRRGAAVCVSSDAAKPADYREIWDAAPFVHVDSMFRPSILTRLVSESNGIWEYTRFLAAQFGDSPRVSALP